MGGTFKLYRMLQDDERRAMNQLGSELKAEARRKKLEARERREKRRAERKKHRKALEEKRDLVAEFDRQFEHAMLGEGPVEEA